jgi:hypothetical protein
MSEVNEVSMELMQIKPQVSLASSAVLVSIDVNVWSATKQDRVISNEVTQSKRADSSAGRFVKNLLADDSNHKKIANYRQTIYTWLQRITYDFNKAQRLLPTVEMEQFMREYREHEATFNALVDDFMTKLPNIISDMAFKQGDMFNRNDYPSEHEIRAKFGIKLYVSEVPTQDWRCQIADDIAEDLHTQYQAQCNEIVENLLNEQIERFVDVMQSIEHCCGVVDMVSEVDGEVKTKKRKIYDSTIEKAKHYCSLYRKFNLSNNKQLQDAVEQLDKALNGISAEVLRESEAVRLKVKDDVSSILSKFGVK